eukprot:364346_1
MNANQTKIKHDRMVSMSTANDEKNDLLSNDKEAKESMQIKKKNNIVYCEGKIKNISDINLADENFKIRMHILLSWDLQDLAFGKPDTYDEKKAGKEYKINNKIPGIEILNIQETIHETDDDSSVGKITRKENKKDGITYWRKKIEYTAILVEGFELQGFPFDCQDLTIHFRTKSDKYVLRARQFKEGSFLRVDRSNMCLKDTELVDTICEFYEESGKETRGGKKYSHFIIRLKLKRNIN